MTLLTYDNKYSDERLIAIYLINTHGFLIDKNKINEHIYSIYKGCNEYITNNVNKNPIDINNINYDKIKNIYTQKQYKHFDKNINTFELFDKTKDYRKYNTKSPKKYIHNYVSSSVSPMTTNAKKKNITEKSHHQSNKNEITTKQKNNTNKWIQVKNTSKKTHK